MIHASRGHGTCGGTDSSGRIVHLLAGSRPNRPLRDLATVNRKRIPSDWSFADIKFMAIIKAEVVKQNGLSAWILLVLAPQLGKSQQVSYLCRGTI